MVVVSQTVLEMNKEKRDTEGDNERVRGDGPRSPQGCASGPGQRAAKAEGSRSGDTAAGSWPLGLARHHHQGAPAAGSQHSAKKGHIIEVGVHILDVASSLAGVLGAVSSVSGIVGARTQGIGARFRSCLGLQQTVEAIASCVPAELRPIRSGPAAAWRAPEQPPEPRRP